MMSANRLVASGWMEESVVVIAAREREGVTLCDSETRENTHVR
jgi:hypothetical protein